MVLSACGPAPDSATTTTDLAPGHYAVLVACESPVTYTLEASEPADAFEPVEVRCSGGTDPEVSRRFTVPDSGVSTTTSESTGDGWYFTALLRVSEVD